MYLKITGFASPAQGYETQTIDLNALMVHHPAATFLFQLESGDIASQYILCLFFRKNPLQ